jgi:long-chain acyl-CoA synthetase
MTPDPILSAFDRVARDHADRVLVASPDDRATVGDLEAQSRALAAPLEGARLPPGALLGLSAPNGSAFLAGLLAARRAGLGTVLLDPQAPPADARRTATGLGAAAVLACPAAFPRSASEWSVERLPGDVPPPPPGCPIVKVTSGSTGEPRGVAVPAAALVADEQGLFTTMGLRDDDRIVAAIPMAHSYGLSSVALPALLRGLPLVLPAGTSPLAPLDAARRLEATFFPTVPAYLGGLVRLGRGERWPPSVRLVVSAGAPLTAATAAGFREVYGHAVHGFYGASECGGICYDRDGGAAERGTVGTPVDGVRVALEPLPGVGDGEGAVVVQSAAVAWGYLPTPDPRLGDGRFRAGDRAAWVDRELQLRGRVDALINVRGRKVDPVEVERVLLDIPGVREVAVVGVPSPPDGGETVRAVVACPPGAVTPAQVLAFCRERLAEHKVPRSLRLVSELPRTARGKLDRQALVAGDPDPVRD